MSTNAETGITPLPDGSELHWSREEVTPEAARLFSDQAAAKRYRVLTLSERDGKLWTVTHFSAQLSDHARVARVACQ